MNWLINRIDRKIINLLETVVQQNNMILSRLVKISDNQAAIDEVYKIEKRDEKVLNEAIKKK